MKKRYKIIADPKYGYLRIDPIPTQEEVERFYLEDFYSTTYKQFNDSSLKVQKEEQGFFNSRWASISKYCSEYFKTHKGLTLFDVGCGFGQALLYFHNKGIRVSGLEPSKEGAEYIKSKGLNVFQCGIEDFSCVGKERFHIITMINVLEHLRHPASTLLNIKRKLIKPKGLLVVDVPNEFNDFQELADKEYGLKRWWVCPPNHINYFSATSLKRLLSKCGYKVIHSESSFPLEIFMLMGDVYVGNPDLGKICHLRRVRFERLMRKYGKEDKLLKLYKALAELDLGRQVTIYASPINK
ncbi:MAG: class I SAM-dependent methyltransferase [Candidatus Omnitrophica bacterium]|nr:class I SAM-dependent methyltransferase [Candidatus Omnitrophota bacterium]